MISVVEPAAIRPLPNTRSAGIVPSSRTRSDCVGAIVVLTTGSFVDVDESSRESSGECSGTESSSIWSSCNACHWIGGKASTRG